MNRKRKAWMKPWASLRLTVVGLAACMVLVFFGTLAQVELGIYEAQQRYFSTWLVWWGPDGADWSIPVFPGGYLVGAVLLVNLTAAHGTRFRLSWKKSGIFLTHLGILLLIIGGFIAAVTTQEDSMRLKEGGSSRFLESFHQRELAFVDVSDPDQDTVVSFDALRLGQGDTLQHERLPFVVEVVQYFPNSRLTRRGPINQGQMLEVDRGFGTELAVVPHPKTYKHDEQNLVSIAARLSDAESGNVEGTWLFTNALDRPQAIEWGGRTFMISLRPTRTYLPYQLHLIDFRHERYPGTEIPFNFSSKVKIDHPEHGEYREALIYMNNPLRFEGRTFFQMSFAENDTVSIFQVVKNPGWLLPYISCALLAAGLTLQFGIHLFGFLTRRGKGTV